MSWAEKARADMDAAKKAQAAGNGTKAAALRKAAQTKMKEAREFSNNGYTSGEVRKRVERTASGMGF